MIYFYTGINNGIILDLGEIADIGLGIYFYIIADHSPGTDIGKGTDIYIFTDFGSRINKAGLFNSFFLRDQFWYKAQEVK